MFSRRAALIGLVMIPLAVGCSSEPTGLPVTGVVTFEGAPVTEGSVTFVDPSTGKGGQAVLAADGRYQIALLPGNYEVTITPVLVTIGGKNGPPAEVYKKVDNIPEKYHSTVTSGIKVAVGPESSSHNFSMTK